MTYSIVARDPSSGELGVAVQTAMFAVGSAVPWATAGVGAVASQAIAEPAYGPRCLAALAGGMDATSALAAARDDDPAAFLRQVGVVSADGSVAAFTGEMCIDRAGDQAGDGYTVQANMMASERVWPAMATAYEGSAGPLSTRLLAALDAAEAAGGDARGCMSAAMVIVDGVVHDDPWQGRLLDVRVDHHNHPLEELRRLVETAGVFAGFHRAVDAVMSGDGEGALALLTPSLATLPRDENMRFLQSGALLLAGQTDEAAASLRALVAGRPSWEVIVRSFEAKGLMAMPPGVTVDAVLG